MVRLYRNFLLAWLWLCAAGIAGEVGLREVAVVDQAVVRLGDVAELYGVTSDLRAELLEMELVPAPAAGATKTVGAREIHEALVRHSPGLSQWTISGASQVAVTRRAAPRQTVEQPKAVRPLKVSRVTGQKSRTQVEEAILDYVRERLGNDAWQIEADLNEAQLAALEDDKVVLVTGGRYLDAERVQFRVEVGEGESRETWKVDASVTLPPMILVAARNLERGEILTAQDVELVREEKKRRTQEPIGSIEDAIGKEVTRSVGKGQPVVAKGLRAMLMVERGQVVTVYSRCGGIQIRTTGRAKEEGGLGDLIPVEAIGTKETFHARVSGHQEVEIVASSPETPAVDDVPREESTWLAERRREAATRSALRRSGSVVK